MQCSNPGRRRRGDHTQPLDDSSELQPISLIDKTPMVLSRGAVREALLPLQILPESQAQPIFIERESQMPPRGFRMSEASGWNELTRFQQRALIKLFGGGSLRNDDPAVAVELRTRGLIDANNALAMPGLRVLTRAMSRQQVEAKSRIAL
jgi:hypothetical protein